MSIDLTRRTFVAAAATGALTLAAGRALGANDRIRIAVIGCGGMGSGHLGQLVKRAEADNVQVVGICDVYQRRIERAKKTGNCEVSNGMRTADQNLNLSYLVTND